MCESFDILKFIICVAMCNMYRLNWESFQKTFWPRPRQLETLSKYVCGYSSFILCNCNRVMCHSLREIWCTSAPVSVYHYNAGIESITSCNFIFGCVHRARIAKVILFFRCLWSLSFSILSKSCFTLICTRIIISS